MSRLLRQDSVQNAAATGSFVIVPRETRFTPWGSEREPDNDEPIVTAELDWANRAQDAYRRGYDEARRTVEAEFAAERDAVARLAEAIEHFRPEPTAPLALLLAETVDRLVREIVGEVGIDPMLLLSRAKAAAALIGEQTQPSALRAHPEDAEILAAADLAVIVKADPALVRGTLVLETGEGWVEDGPAVRLDRLRGALDQMAAAR